MLQWKRLLGQENFYIKYNFGEYLPTADDLLEMLHSKSYTSLMRKTQYCAKTICENNSYWY